MSFLGKIFGRNKKLTATQKLEKLEDYLLDQKVKVSARKIRLFKEMKNKYAMKGKMPPSSSLAFWRRYKIQEKNYDTMYRYVREMRIVAEDMEERDRESVNFEEIRPLLKEMQKHLRSEMRTETRMIQDFASGINNFDDLLNALSDTMNLDDIVSEETVDDFKESFGTEFLKDLEVEDPDLYKEFTSKKNVDKSDF